MKQLKQLFSASQETKIRLTPFKKTLFYFYLIFAVLGCFGIAFSCVSILLKFTSTHYIATTPWWQIIVLALTSLATARLFINECNHMLTSNKPDNIIRLKDYPTQEGSEFQKSSSSNVIPFTKKQEW